jgi:hypothetical protein
VLALVYSLTHTSSQLIVSSQHSKRVFEVRPDLSYTTSLLGAKLGFPYPGAARSHYYLINRELVANIRSPISQSEASAQYTRRVTAQHVGARILPGRWRTTVSAAEVRTFAQAFQAYHHHLPSLFPTSPIHPHTHILHQQLWPTSAPRPVPTRPTNAIRRSSPPAAANVLPASCAGTAETEEG